MLGILRRWAKVEVFGARVDGEADAFQTAIQAQQTGQVPPVFRLLWFWDKGRRLDHHVLPLIRQ
jgi:hypothetical protein